VRIAILSDIHGNLEALTSVLQDLEERRVETTICLGDCVGYGPDPEEVIQVIRERGIQCILGNHELGLIDQDHGLHFNPAALLSLRLTRKFLSRNSFDYIRGLPKTLTVAGALCVHGCPPDSVTRYLFDVPDGDLALILGNLPKRVCFVGHTHELKLVTCHEGKVSRAPLPEGILRLAAGPRYVVNAGSVGQPRDGNNNAKYVVWDTEAETLDVRFVPYDIAATVRKILAGGFPEYNAQRLW